MKKDSMDILLLNGPNLNLLGEREVDIYGKINLSSIENSVQEIVEKAGFRFCAFQSNHEGEIIDKIHAHKGIKLILINPGAYSHTSLAIVDALSAINVPYIEIHLSNIYAREEFRSHSYFSKKAQGVISGFGALGYQLAATAGITLIKK